MNFSDFLIWCSWTYLEVIFKKIVNKGSKFGPPGQKMTIFCHFCSFLVLKIFPVNQFFWFFNMVFLSLFRSHLQKIVKRGSQFGLVGPKNSNFWLFLQFFGLGIFSSEWFFLIFWYDVFAHVYKSFERYREKRVKIRPPRAKKTHHFLPFLQSFGLR